MPQKQTYEAQQSLLALAWRMPSLYLPEQGVLRSLAALPHRAGAPLPGLDMWVQCHVLQACHAARELTQNAHCAANALSVDVHRIAASVIACRAGLGI